VKKKRKSSDKLISRLTARSMHSKNNCELKKRMSYLDCRWRPKARLDRMNEMQSVNLSKKRKQFKISMIGSREQLSNQNKRDMSLRLKNSRKSNKKCCQIKELILKS